MLTKTLPAVLLKAAGDDGLAAGQFEALVSVMDVKDAYGDVIRPGAFDDTLATWKESGNPIPVVWSHGYSNVDNHIGYLLDAAERTIGDKTGLWVKGQLDTEPDDHVALKVAKLFKGRRVTQFSFSYDVTEGAIGHSEEWGDFYDLRKLKLYEVGPTLIGANQDTELLAAKALREIAAEIKAGRVLSAKNEDLLRTAHESIGTVLAALDSNDGKAMTGEPSPTGGHAHGAADKSALDQLELELLIGLNH
jgi:HK97 family phage prohead protease